MKRERKKKKWHIPVRSGRDRFKKYLLALILMSSVTQGVLASKQQDIRCSSHAVTKTTTKTKTEVTKASHSNAEHHLEVYEGKTIKSITININDIFDTSLPEEDKFFFRLANRLQVNTQNNVIRSQLLFKEGDSLNSTKIEESLRILYSREYVLDTHIIASSTCDGSVDLNIIIRDAWVIQPSLNFSNKGGESESAVGIIDGNLFGSGNEVGLKYKDGENGAELGYQFRTDHLLSTRYQLEIYHTELPEGQGRNFALKQPFYALDSKWSYGLSSESLSSEKNIRYREQTIDRYHYEYLYDEVFIGRSIDLDERSSLRVLSGIGRFSETLSASLLIDKTKHLDYQVAWIGLEKVTGDYKRYINFNYIGRPENIAVQTEFDIKLGIGQEDDGSRVSLFSANFYSTLLNTRNTLWQASIQSNWLQVDSPDHENRFTAEVSSEYYFFVDIKNQWAIKSHYALGHKLRPHEHFGLGEQSGLRGYPNDYQRGTKRYLVSVERRFYSDLHLYNLVRVGFLGFVDLGKAWGLRNFNIDEDTTIQFEGQEVLSSAGFGIRLHSSKTGSPAVVHINLGIPLVRPDTGDDHELDSYLISVSAEQRF